MATQLNVVCLEQIRVNVAILVIQLSLSGYDVTSAADSGNACWHFRLLCALVNNIPRRVAVLCCLGVASMTGMALLRL
jgi:hypothetical protein